MNRNLDDEGYSRQPSAAVQRALQSMRDQVDSDEDAEIEDAPRLSQAFAEPRRFVYPGQTTRMPEDPPPPPAARGPWMSNQAEEEILDRLDEIEAKLGNMEARLIQILQQVSKISRR